MSGPVVSTPVESYDKVMDINVRSIVILTQACIPRLIESKGTIVNVSSITGPCSVCSPDCIVAEILKGIVFWYCMQYSLVPRCDLLLHVKRCLGSVHEMFGIGNGPTRSSGQLSQVRVIRLVL